MRQSQRVRTIIRSQESPYPEPGVIWIKKHLDGKYQMFYWENGDWVLIGTIDAALFLENLQIDTIYSAKTFKPQIEKILLSENEAELNFTFPENKEYIYLEYPEGSSYSYPMDIDTNWTVSITD